MSPEAQRIAIAEACGWEWKPGHFTEWGATEPLNQWHDTNGKTGKTPPDYLHDLNAMHEAERQLVLTMSRTSIPAYICCNEASNYFRHLIKACGEWNPIHATAAQRAEAFLRTIGKWDDSK